MYHFEAAIPAPRHPNTPKGRKISHGSLAAILETVTKRPQGHFDANTCFRGVARGCRGAVMSTPCVLEVRIEVSEIETIRLAKSKPYLSCLQ